MSENKRKFTRVPFKVKTRIEADDISYEVDEIYNLSVGGCLLPANADLEVGARCDITILLNEEDDGLNVRVAGDVVRSATEDVAVKFKLIEPESLYHLQNIIRYNAEDPDRIEDEISKHPGIF